MLNIPCPLCADTATTDDGLTVVTCERCGVVVDVAPDPDIPALPIAA